VASDDEILERFKDVDVDDNHRYITSTLERDPSFDEKDFNFRQDDLEAIW
jgi:hypothetical protein